MNEPEAWAAIRGQIDSLLRSYHPELLQEGGDTYKYLWSLSDEELQRIFCSAIANEMKS